MNFLDTIFKKVLFAIMLSCFAAPFFTCAHAVGLPSDATAYFSDPDYNYEREIWNEETGELEKEEKSHVYKVFYQQNRDGSGYIDLYWVETYVHHLTAEIFMYYESEGQIIRYAPGTYDIYIDSAPWSVYECRKHITEGTTVLLDVTDDYPLKDDQTPATMPPMPESEPTQNTAKETARTQETNNNTATDYPTETIEPTATIEVSPSPALTAEPTDILTAEPTDILTAEPTDILTPTPTAYSTAQSTEDVYPIHTPAPINTGITNFADTNYIKVLLGIIAAILVVALIVTIKAYSNQRKTERDYYDR